ncbi:galactose-6-sulfurylase [Malassezia yamatoensis]|uniref:Protein farnesyltransferase/geranylgeranyltransferase type-1 subunit alpha n=1 Tax=Malassezia yamatoensis TaxID=253288 RepID=A0AAJ5YS22_9BASI|nr:galactose-6-sulfurylase [Malassezia yamatoensis]
MDLFRGLKQLHPSGVEASERALSLTQLLVNLNPANYSIWQYRAQVLIELSASGPNSDRLLKELDFLDESAKYNMKNYQIWQHRKILVSVLGDPSRELAFTKANLQLDMKNYHTWAYRQWVLAYFGGTHESKQNESLPGAGQYPELWDGELDFADEMIQEDIRNNSAYNHRWYCIFGRYSKRGELDVALETKREKEIQYTLDKIAQAPNNASPWNYLRGLFTAIEPKKPFEALDKLFHAYLSEPNHQQAAQSAEIDANGRTVPYALEWLLDSQLEQLENLPDNHSRVQDCRYIFQRLRHADPARWKYWQYRESEMQRYYDREHVEKQS